MVAKKVNYKTMSIGDLAKSMQEHVTELGRIMEAMSAADEAKREAISMLNKLGIGATHSFPPVATTPFGQQQIVQPGLMPGSVSSYNIRPTSEQAELFSDTEMLVMPMEPGQESIESTAFVPVAALPQVLEPSTNMDELRRQIASRIEEIQPSVEL